MKRTALALIVLILLAAPVALAAPAGAREAAPDAGPQLAMAVATPSLPSHDGDVLTITATLTNTTAAPLWCAGFSQAVVHPAASFEAVSAPPSQPTTGLGPGEAITGTWTFQLHGPLPPAATIGVEAYGAGNPPECPGVGAERPTTLRTEHLGATTAVSPFATWAALVDQQYRDLLGRPPTAAEASPWVAALAAGTTTPGELVHQLRRSPDNVANVDATSRLYWAFLHRTPDRGGLQFWISRRRSGAWPLVRMADQFAGSSEFARRYGALTNRQFVARIYPDVLLRVPDPSGLDYWTRQLDLKRRSRGAVMVAFSESAEAKRAWDTSTDANAAHLLLLGRPPSDAEATWWYRNLRSGVPHQELLSEVLASAEYRDRITG